MITAILQDTNLPDYYKSLRILHEKHHTKEYTLVHDDIKQLLSECSSYTEFGIMQGATLAVPCLMNIPVITAYDINLDWYNHAKGLFEEYAKQNNINFNVYKQDTLKCDIKQVDLLYIDTLHVYKQLIAELTKHSEKVNKYIVMHDTEACPPLKQAIREFLQKNKKWELFKECKESVGYSILKRK